MLINSNSWKGKCPICGAANSTCGGPSNIHQVDQTAAASPGPLRLYPQGRGRFIQLTDDAARARGFLPPEAKQRDSAPNKMRRPAQNKARG